MEEEAVDNGGPSREFWRLFVEEVVHQYCVGEPGVSLFMNNVPALQVYTSLYYNCRHVPPVNEFFGL